MQLNMQKLAYRKPPLEDSLHRIGVLGAMQTKLSVFDSSLPEPDIAKLTQQGKLLIMDKEGEYYWNEVIESSDHTHRYRQHKLIALSSRETLAEAYWALKEQRCGAVYIYDQSTRDIIGLITFNQIRRYLLEGKII